MGEGQASDCFTISQEPGRATDRGSFGEERKNKERENNGVNIGHTIVKEVANIFTLIPTDSDFLCFLGVIGSGELRYII